jgi:hypothetical protein
MQACQPPPADVLLSGSCQVPVNQCRGGTPCAKPTPQTVKAVEHILQSMWIIILYHGSGLIQCAFPVHCQEQSRIHFKAATHAVKVFEMNRKSNLNSVLSLQLSLLFFTSPDSSSAGC